MKRILVTGGRGMLGTAIARRCPRDEAELLPLDLPEFDVTDPDAVRERMAASQPELVIHCAALTDVDACETDPSRALAVNATAALDLARECAARHVPMVYVSTDFVFDGDRREPYTEEDPTHPISVYGETKLAGEAHTRATLAEHTIVRTAWTFAPWGRNFVRSILRAAREKPELRVVDDQVGSPTYAPDLADGLWRLIATGAYGAYHLTNQGVVSRYEFARQILVAAGLGDVPVIRIKSAELNQPARRPSFSALVSVRLPAIGLPLLRPYREALAECVAEIQRSEGEPS